MIAAATTPTSSHGLKPSEPGRTIKSTPANPANTAPMRTALSCSWSNRAATKVTTIGTNCRIAVRLASGALVSAVR